MLAEELDVDLAEVRLDPGVPSAAYYNGVVTAEGVPIAATSDSVLARTGRGASEVVAKLMGLQVTGGSSTVPDMLDRLRYAGAVARETLIAAAAQQTGLNRDQLSTENGAVVLPDGMRLDYADLAATAADIEPVEPAALRDPSTWRALGHDHLRTDITAKSTGTQDYGIDTVSYTHLTLPTNREV